MEKPCKCRGMNGECVNCGGSGVVKDKEIHIIRIVSTKAQIEKEKAELESYLNPDSEKLYTSDNKSLPRTKKKSLVKKKKKKKASDNQSNKKAKTKNHKNLQQSEIVPAINFEEEHLEISLPRKLEREFLAFWKNNISWILLTCDEYTQSATLFSLIEKETAREKFKLALMKHANSNRIISASFVQILFDKLKH